MKYSSSSPGERSIDSKASFKLEEGSFSFLLFVARTGLVVRQKL